MITGTNQGGNYQEASITVIPEEISTIPRPSKRALNMGSVTECTLVGPKVNRITKPHMSKDTVQLLAPVKSHPVCSTMIQGEELGKKRHVNGLVPEELSEIGSKW